MNADQMQRMKADERDVFLPTVDMGELLHATWLKLLRNWVILLGLLATAIIGAVYYVLTATPLYTANGALLIDPRSGQALEARPQSSSAIGSLDGLTVDSQLRVLTSREVTTNAMQTLLAQNPVAEGENTDAEPGLSLRAQLESILGLSTPVADPNALPGPLQMQRQQEAARRGFVKGLEAQRAGDSYVIDIKYTSPDVAFSAAAVNTLMREYIRASGKQQTAQIERTRDWLSERIIELEADVRAAETAVAQFRGENALVAMQGELLPTEIALNAAFERLIQLREEALVLDINVQQLSEQIAAGQIEAVQIPTEERSSALEDFQTRYAALLREEQELLLAWSEDAPIVLSRRQEQEQIRALILQEFAQIRDHLAARHSALERQVQATETVIDDLRSEYTGSSRQTVELRNLEREAASKRQLYERLLEEYNSSSQLLTFDGSTAQVIAWAVPPDKKSAPQSRQVLVMAVFGALVLGIGVILLKEAMDSSFRNADDVTRDLGLRYLGLVPTFNSERYGGFLRRISGRRNPRPGANWKRLSPAAQRFGFSAEWPHSITTETMRSIRVQLKLQDGERTAHPAQATVVGFTSTTNSEGKTTTAFNFANTLASQGERVAIIDCDMISSQMSKALAPVLPKANELNQLLTVPADAISQLQPTAEFPGLCIIGHRRDANGAQPLAGEPEKLDALLTVLKAHFDVIVMDMPPVQGVATTRLMMTRLCDHIVYSVRWGWTTRKQVTSIFRRGLLPKDRILGVLFTRADLKKYRFYDQNGDSYYYH